MQRVRLLPTGLQEESPVFYITRSLEVTAAQVIPDMPLPRGVVLFRDDLDKVAHLGEGAYEDAIGFVKTQLGNLAVRLNDWIVTDAQGLCLVYGPEEFEARFNLAVDSADGSDFVRAFNLFADVVYRWAMRKKLWETKPSPFELICLIQEAVASAAKAAREGDPVDRDCPNHNSIEVRLADAIIHIMNARGGYGLRVGEAIVAKMKFNDDRPYVRGRKI